MFDIIEARYVRREHAKSPSLVKSLGINHRVRSVTGMVIPSAIFVVILLSVLALGSARTVHIAPTVQTDKQDYGPGETVHIIGMGWTPGYVVSISMTRPDGSTQSCVAPSTPGFSNSCPSAHSSGNFGADYKLDGINGTYYVTAKYGTNTATVTFTDAVVPIIGRITPVMVDIIGGFINRNTNALISRVMTDVERTSAVAMGDGSTSAAPPFASAAPAPTANFEGLHTTVDCTLPPDSDGAVGPTYYVAFVNNYNNCATQTPSGNVGFYCKAASGGVCTSQGILAAAFYYPDLLSSLTTNCNLKTGHSDPQLIYDSAKDRYLLVDITTSSPYQLCIAATLSNDPVGGSYCVASYPTQGPSLPDYDKAGIWTDGFYVSYNPQSSISGDSRTVVFNKDDFEACKTIRTEDFDMGASGSQSDNQCGNPQPNHIFRPDPATYSIFTGVPAVGEPEFIVASYCLTSHVWVFTLHVDWSNGANSLLTRASIATQIRSIAPLNVASPGNPLDTLRLHTMVPAPYFKDNSGNEYVWTTITSRGSSTSSSAIAWYQFKVVNNASGSTTVANQNIWNPDATSRLQAAAAFDRQGDVLMDYTQVSSSQNPAVAYAGRLASDPANTIGQTETVLFRGPTMGSGACSTQIPCLRWGDYSSNFIDPNGCTFWFTHEYYNVSDPWQWDTRIGATQYSTCTPLTYSRSVSPTSLSYTSSGTGVTTAPQNVTVTNTGTGPLVVQAPNITGTNPGDFSVSSNNCSTAEAGVVAGTSCTIQATCTPSASGTRTATLNIMTNVGAADSKSVFLSCSNGFDYEMTSSGRISTVQGGSGSSTITVALLIGISQPVAFSCSSGLPTGASCSFNPSSGSPSFSSTVTVNTTSSSPIGLYNITITGSSGTLTHTTQFVLDVCGHLAGDANGDCVVDVSDLAIVGAAFGSTPSSPNWNLKADLDGDGKVDVSDLAIVGAHFGQHIP